MPAKDKTREISGRLEHAGRRLDKEIDRLIDVLDKKVRPAAQKHSAELFRDTARALGKLAARLERRQRGKPPAR